MRTISPSRPAIEKRRHRRIPLGLTLDIQAQGQPLGRCRGTIADLSEGGMSLRTDAELEEGMCILLTLDAPLTIRGEIRHSLAAEPGGLRRYGVRFHMVDGRSRFQENRP